MQINIHYIAKYLIMNLIFHSDFLEVTFVTPAKSLVAIKAAELHGNASELKQKKAENELHLRKAEVFNV